MPTLLERDGHLAQLARWLVEAEDGHGSVVLVSGEAGSGKTSLIWESSQHVEVWCGWCDPLVTPRPLGPLHDIARQVGGPLLDLVRSSQQPSDVYAALLDLLTDRDEAVVVMIEDAHWADEATVTMLQYLGRRIGGTRALVLVTFRDEEVGPEHLLRRALADLSRHPQTVHRLAVGPLTPDGVARLAVGSGLDPAELFDVTNGNPFFVTEVVAAGGGVPATVQDAVHGRLAALAADERRLVEALSTEPRGLEAHLVGPWTGLEAAVVARTELTGVIQVDRDVLRFRHDVARLATYQAIPSVTRAQLHRGMLRLLEDQGSSDSARLAHHAIGAGDPAAIVRHARSAGLEAMRLDANTEAIAFLRESLEHLHEPGPAETTGILMSLSDAISRLGDQDGAGVVAQEAVTTARRATDALLIGEAEVALARIQWRRGDPAGSRERLDGAVADLMVGGASRPLAQALTESARVHMLARRLAPALDQAREAARTAVAIGSEDDLVRARLVEGTALLVMGDADLGIPLLEETRARGESMGDRTLVADSLLMLGSGGGEVRRYEPALGWLAELVDEARGHDQDYVVAYGRAWQSRIAFEQGRWDESAELAHQVVSGQAAPRTRLTALGVLGRLRVKRGDPQAREALTEALGMTGLDLQHRWPSLCALAELSWLDGSGPTAPETLAPAYEESLHTDSSWARGELGLWMWRFGLLDAPPPGAAEPFGAQIAGDWRTAARLWREIGCPYEEASALVDGDPEAVVAGLEILDRLGARPLGALVRSRLRRDGLVVPRGPRASTRDHPAGLTSREAEVHDLLVEGLSNPAIAARLFLSRRTVEHHVSAVLAKCGVVSRDDLRSG
ncbi:AAA family ATPase [Nocardioides sp.]|uniref:ATP-binding protein n=1 Tax=Nocardioides sp. TaxID=35761 RepID=UPI0031FF127F|nr:transcriptional regulator, LuxR family [Nocardioides sp.]